MSHLTHEQLVDYWTVELAADARDAIEDHLFACEPCAAEAERVAAIVAALRTQIPPVISADQLAALRAQGIAIEENTFLPGQRTSVTFAPGLDLMIHHLGGLDLADAERISLTVRSRASGAVLHHDPIAPFDRARGEVLIACQRHFATLPADPVFDLEIHRAAGAPSHASYDIPHKF